mmetsp:Transcript_35477/g.52096  ORF Transcript_35477/g.52096 Transcript_35477/m.52096 type:complete len:221 (+) Transcript_35477:1375-2037(+)
MIPLLGLNKHLLVSLQLLRVLPSSGINPLQHLPGLISTPIGTRHILKRNGLLGQLAGTLDMRTSTQIPPLIRNVINRNGLRLDRVQNLEFEGFVDLLDATLGLLPRHLLPSDFQIRRNDFVHSFLDGLQVGIAQFAAWQHFIRVLRVWLRQEVEVVVEAVVDPWPDGCLRVWEQLLHGHGHHVRGRVSHFQEVFAGVVRRQFHFHFHCFAFYRRTGHFTD